MATVTAPIILDSTGQQIVTKLQSIADNVKPTADQIKRTSSNNQTVEAALVSLNSQISTITNLTSSITKTSKYADATIEIRKIGRICFLEIYIPSSISVTEGDYLTDVLPGAAGPWIDNRFVATKLNGSFVIGFANAKLQIYTAPPSGTGSVYLSASYLANTI